MKIFWLTWCTSSSRIQAVLFRCTFRIPGSLCMSYLRNVLSPWPLPNYLNRSGLCWNSFCWFGWTIFYLSSKQFWTRACSRGRRRLWVVHWLYLWKPSGVTDVTFNVFAWFGHSTLKAFLLVSQCQTLFLTSKNVAMEFVEHFRSKFSFHMQSTQRMLKVPSRRSIKLEHLRIFLKFWGYFFRLSL